jgi:hypothetical protein
MSWIAATALFVIVGFTLAFGFSEWLVRRRARAGSDDWPAPG